MLKNQQHEKSKSALNNDHKQQKLGFNLQSIAYDNEFQIKVLFSYEKNFLTSNQKKHVYRLKIQSFQKIIYF